MADPRPKLWAGWFIAASAFIAVYSGWVGIGEMTGYGEFHPFPGIAPDVVINTAITLPLGMEAYGMWASYIWLHRGTPQRARRFAGFSALLALFLGALGQVAFHLLKTNGYTTAPDEVVVFVSVLPVIVAGLAMVLVHMVVHGSGPAPQRRRLPKLQWSKVVARFEWPKLPKTKESQKISEELKEVSAPPAAEAKPSPDPVHPKLPKQRQLRVVDQTSDPKLTPRQRERVQELLPEARKIWASLERPSGKALSAALGGINATVASELARILRTEGETSSGREDQVG